MRVNRRTFMKASAATGAALAAGSVFAPAVHAAKSIKIGYVSPQTGPLAAFAEADNFVISNFLETVKDGVKVGSATYPVEVAVKDSQSNPNRAAEVAKELIVGNKIDLMLVASTPETTNPVATQCEIEEVPCISTVAPWQPYFIGRQGNPGDPPSWKPFNYTYHFFWGLEDVIAVFTNMWGQLKTNKSVGGLFPNDGDGNAWGDKMVGFPPVLDKLGYKLTDPGRYQNLTDDFSAQIARSRRRTARSSPAWCCRPTSPPSGIRRSSRGSSRRRPRSARRSCSRWRSRRSARQRQQPFLGGLVVAEPSVQVVADRTCRPRTLADAYQKSSGKQWTQPIGFIHALFEVAVDVLKRSPRRRRQQGDREGDRRDQSRHGRRPHRLGRTRTCRRSRRRISPRRRSSAASGGCARRQQVRHRHHRQQDRAGNSGRAARWSRSPEAGRHSIHAWPTSGRDAAGISSARSAQAGIQGLALPCGNWRVGVCARRVLERNRFKPK